MLRAIAERFDGLTSDEMSAVCAAANGCRVAESLDAAEANLRALFPGWFVYRGGSHVALHRSAGDELRVLMVRELVLSSDALDDYRRQAWGRVGAPR